MIDVVNRALLGLIALGLGAAGVVGLLAARGLVPIMQPAAMYEQLTTTAARPAVFWAIVAGCAVAALLAMWWAFSQLIVHRPGAGLGTVIIDKTDKGRTSVESSAVAAAAAAGLRRLPNVMDSSARLVGDGRSFALRSRLDVDDSADLVTVRKSITEVYADAAAALGMERMRSHTRLRPVGNPRRVH